MKTVNEKRKKSERSSPNRFAVLMTAAAFCVATAAVGCAMDPELPTGEKSGEMQDSPDLREYPAVRASDLQPDLPGCLETLNDPATDMDGETELKVVVENPNLAVLVTAEGRQLCVDDTSSLDQWLNTGRWPEHEPPAGAPEINTENRSRNQMAGTVVVNSGGMNNRFPRTAPIQHNRMGSGSVAGPVDDSNPLPPYPNPIR